jgi:hypothetical protein
VTVRFALYTLQCKFYSYSKVPTQPRTGFGRRCAERLAPCTPRHIYIEPGHRNWCCLYIDRQLMQRHSVSITPLSTSPFPCRVGCSQMYASVVRRHPCPRDTTNGLTGCDRGAIMQRPCTPARLIVWHPPAPPPKRHGNDHGVCVVVATGPQPRDYPPTPPPPPAHPPLTLSSSTNPYVIKDACFDVSLNLISALLVVSYTSRDALSLRYPPQGCVRPLAQKRRRGQPTRRTTVLAQNRILYCIFSEYRMQHTNSVWLSMW